MKKILALLLVLCMMLPFAVLAEEAAAVKTGLSFTTSLTSSKDGQAQANISITAVMVDENGVITACVIDVIQGKIAFDATGKVTTDKATVFQSKQELGDAYGMRKASAIGKEWFEQADALEAWCVGKTLEQVMAAPLNNGYPTDADLVTGCTMSITDYLLALQKAVELAK